MFISFLAFVILCVLNAFHSSQFSLANAAITRGIRSQSHVERMLRRCLLILNSASEIITADHPQYRIYNLQWHLDPEPKYPRGFIVVHSAKDVSKAIICGRKYGAKMTAKSGGHGVPKYAFGNNDTWVIELAKINQIKISETSDEIEIGAGVKLVDLGTKLSDRKELGLILGFCHEVGVSGFTLGGGYGLAIRKFGMMVDRLAEVEVVTADGKIRVSNSRKNSDLFWALRGGGGGNFGIATKFKFNAFKANFPFISIVKRYKGIESVTSLYYAWQKYFTSKEANEYPGIFSMLAYTRENDQPELLAAFVIVEENEEKRNFYLERVKTLFANISAADIQTYSSYIDVWFSFSQSYIQYEPSKAPYFSTKDFFVKTAISRQEANEFFAELQTFNFITAVFTSFGGFINKINRRQTAYVHRDTYYDVQINVLSDESLPVNEKIRLGNERKALIANWLRTLSLYSDESYQNAMDIDLENWACRYYGANLQRLTKVKRRYDPSNFFSFKQSIPLYCRESCCFSQ